MTQQKHPASLIVRLFGGFALVYALLVLVAWVIKTLVPTEVGIAGMVESVLQLLMFPALVLLPLCLLLRRWRAVLALLAVFALFVFSYGHYFLPRALQAAAGTEELRILTFNIQSPEDAVDPILSVIRAADADVVALQELNSAVAERLQGDLSDLYSH